MIQIYITCDHAEGGRTKEGKPSNWCRTHQTAAPGGEARDFDTASSKAREAARIAGWKRTKINPMGQRGYLCPTCYARAYEGA